MEYPRGSGQWSMAKFSILRVRNRKNLKKVIKISFHNFCFLVILGAALKSIFGGGDSVS